MAILIKNIDVIPMTGKGVFLENANIFIKDNKIKDIYKGDKDYKYNRVIDGKDKLILPGLVNAHTHGGMSVLRNYADDLPLKEWLESKIWPIEGKFKEEDVYWASYLSIAEMIEGGTTTFSDMYFFMDEVAKIVGKSGIRAVISRGATDDGDPLENTKKIEDMRNLYKNWNNKFNGRLKVFVGAHAPYTCGENFLKDCINLASELETGLHIHLSETEKELRDSIEEKGMSPIEYCESLGMYEVHTLAAHCVHLGQKDLDIMERSNIYPVNNPTSNLKLASGFAPVKDMLKRKIKVSLGTDGASSNNNLNMFEEIKLAGILNKAVEKDATAISAYEALEMATINGAKALKLDQEIGSIEVGKKADLIILDMKKTHLFPKNNLFSSLVYSTQASDVETVIIDGKIIMEDRIIKSFDLEEVYYEVEKIQKKLINNI